MFLILSQKIFILSQKKNPSVTDILLLFVTWTYFSDQGDQFQMSARQGITVRKRKSRSRRAGLLFPVGRIHRLCRKGPWVGSRISAGAPVYLAAVMEYLTAELLEQAGLVARYGSSDRISPRHIRKAVKTDEELDKLCEGVVMIGGDGEEAENGISERLLRADMAGVLPRLTHRSLTKQRGTQERIKNKMYKIPKLKNSYRIPKLAPNDQAVEVVELTENDSCFEQVIDLTGENLLEKRVNIDGKIQGKKSNKDVNGNNIVDLTEDDRFMVDKTYMQGKFEKKGCGANTANKVAMAFTVFKSSGKIIKPHRFEEEMKKTDRKLDKVYEKKKKSRSRSSCQPVEIIEIED